MNLSITTIKSYYQMGFIARPDRFWICLFKAGEIKLNFTPEKSRSIKDLGGLLFTKFI
jgi:hypothetical protein